MLWDQNGAAGHSDMGYGYIVGEDDKWAANPYGVRVWQFGAEHDLGRRPSGVRHVRPGTVREWGTSRTATRSPDCRYDQQMACSSNAGDLSLSRTNEIVCFRLDGSMQVLVVAPNMTDLNASGGGSDAYSKRPKGNIDPTGEYFLWTSNMGGNRADVFVVRIPAHLLGVAPVPTTCARAGTSSGSGTGTGPGAGPGTRSCTRSRASRRRSPMPFSGCSRSTSRRRRTAW